MAEFAEKLIVPVLLGSVRRDRQGIRAARLLVRALRERGHEPVLVDPLEKPLPLLDRMYKEHPKGEAPALLEELATLLGAGVALSEALQAVQRGERPAQLAASLEELARAVRRGENFADSLRRCVPGLPSYVHALAQAGETVVRAKPLVQDSQNRRLPRTATAE